MTNTSLMIIFTHPFVHSKIMTGEFNRFTYVPMGPMHLCDYKCPSALSPGAIAIPHLDVLFRCAPQPQQHVSHH